MVYRRHDPAEVKAIGQSFWAQYRWKCFLAMDYVITLYIVFQLLWRQN